MYLQGDNTKLLFIYYANIDVYSDVNNARVRLGRRRPVSETVVAHSCSSSPAGEWWSTPPISIIMSIMVSIIMSVVSVVMLIMMLTLLSIMLSIIMSMMLSIISDTLWSAPPPSPSSTASLRSRASSPGFRLSWSG